MPTWTKELLISLGGGATVALTLLAILKFLVTKYFDTAMNSYFEKSIIRLTNRLERSTRAYEILLKKEFDYYEKLDPYMATIVPLVQDLVYNYDESQNNNSSDSKERYRNLLLEYLKMIPEIKNDSILFQPYIPENIFGSVSILLDNMQSEAEYLSDVARMIISDPNENIDRDRLKTVSDKILMSVSLIETRIKTRLKELSSN